MNLGWMWTDNLRPLVVELARMTGYPFSDSDWIAIAQGIGATDAEDRRWFGYPLGHITLRAALEPGADEMVSVEIDGATEDEQLRIGWLGDVMREWHLSSRTDSS